MLTKLFLCSTMCTRFDQEFEVEVQVRCLVEVMNLNLGRYSEDKFDQDFDGFV